MLLRRVMTSHMCRVALFVVAVTLTGYSVVVTTSPLSYDVGGAKRESQTTSSNLLFAQVKTTRKRNVSTRSQTFNQVVKKPSKPTRKRKGPTLLKRRKKTVKVRPEQILSKEDEILFNNKLIKSFGQDYQNSKQYRTIVKSCSEYSQHPGRLLFYDTSPYIETQPHLCDGTPEVLIAIHTRPVNSNRRHLIRNTYGSMRNVNGKKVVIAFFLGKSGNANIEKQIQRESKDYRDIIQRDFKENYRNMTYKHLTVMDWIMEFCPHVKYLVKVDDDVFVNIFQVVDFISTFNPPGFYCTRTTGPKPMRKGGKWKVTYDEYSKENFPPYCMGYAYVMRASHAKEIYWCSVFSKYLWIDDVHVGGTLPEKLGIRLDRFISGHNSAYILPSHASWKIVDFMFLLGTRNELLPGVIKKIWRASLQYSY